MLFSYKWFIGDFGCFLGFNWEGFEFVTFLGRLRVTFFGYELRVTSYELL